MAIAPLTFTIRPARPTLFQCLSIAFEKFFFTVHYLHGCFFFGCDYLFNFIRCVAERESIFFDSGRFFKVLIIFRSFLFVISNTAKKNKEPSTSRVFATKTAL